MDHREKYFSVLGDSISTFQGYSPWGADHYAPDLAAATGVAAVEDTWWMRVIQTLGGTFLSNLSISGNTICTAGKMGGFPPGRIRQLTVQGQAPQRVLLYAGLNDVMFYVPVEVFQAEYCLLLSRLRQAYPQAQVFCGTLLLGEVAGTQGSLRGVLQRMAPYNEAIRAAAAQEGGLLVDLAAQSTRYLALDAFHPTGEGMVQLAVCWLRAMKAAGYAP